MSINKQQTAVELLKSSIQVSIETLSGELNEYQSGYKQCLIDMHNEIDSKFLEIEKKRMKEAMHMQVKKYTTAYFDEDGNPQLSYDIEDSFKDYWNETYGGVKE